MAVMEVFEMDKDLENAILKGANELDIAKIVRQKGMITMKEDAIVKSMNKLVPFEEVNML
jgi:type II secretory ATPase GspE/PulE/Tfp pilus assembly ATPase PilB-like protein